jgi:pSer/pThr/pTyr-binding forkhead associated (FHA) protein
VSEAYTFGTAADCDIRIVDPYASPHHARAWRDPHGNVWVDDLGSTNGTWVIHNGVRYRAQPRLPLEPGDTLVIGRTRLPWTGARP